MWVFAVCLFTVLAVLITYFANGQKQSYSSLQTESSCSAQCKQLLDMPWFPFWAVLPLSYFRSIDLSLYQMQPNPTLNYYMCNEIQTSQQQTTFEGRVPKIALDVSNFSLRLSYSSQPYKFEFKQDCSLGVGQQLLQTEDRVANVNVKNDTGVIVQMESLKNLKEITTRRIATQNCVPLAYNTDYAQYQYLVAMKEKLNTTVDPIYFNFVRSNPYQNAADYVGFAATACSLVGLLESLIYVCYEFWAIKHIVQRTDEWLSYIENEKNLLNETDDVYPTYVEEDREDEPLIN